MANLKLIFDQVDDEMDRAIEKHGFKRTPMNPEMSNERRFILLAEEVGEVARALTYDEGSRNKLREELIQVAARAVGAICGMDDEL